MDEEISLGDFILSGGEVASLAIMDSLIRHLPGVLGNEDSCEEESFREFLLEAPQFTRPREWEGVSVPEVLLSGDHQKVKLWRKVLAIIKTAQLRPDLLESYVDRKRGAKDKGVSEGRPLDELFINVVEVKREILQMSDGELFSCGLNRGEILRICDEISRSFFDDKVETESGEDV